MSDITYEDMINLRREQAIKTNTSRFVINAITPKDRAYSRNKDKDGLSREERNRVEAAKDRLAYPPEEDDPFFCENLS